MLKGFQIIDVITTNSDFSFDDRTDNCSLCFTSISIIQFKNEAKEYHQSDWNVKENAVRSINYPFYNNLPLTTEN
jgi:hypothetical protein